MELLRRDHGSPRRSRPVSSSASDLTKNQPVSKLIIIQARFQQKQLQEKEEKLLRLYEEQQERAMNRVGAHVQSGGGSVSSTSSVGRGKVRHMFQARRGTSESRQGRDRSYPLEPISAKASLPVRTQSLDVAQGTKQRIPGSWSNASLRSRGNALSRNNSDLLPRRLGQYYGEYDEYENGYDERERPRKGSVRRTQSQSREPKSKLLYFGGSHTDLRFSDELDYVQTFHVIDDHYEIPDRDLTKKKGRTVLEERRGKDNETFYRNFNDKRQFYESRLSRESSGNEELYQRLPNIGGNGSAGMSQRKESELRTSPRSRTFVSQKPFSEKPHLGVKKSDVPAVREVASPTSRASNGPAAPTMTVKARKQLPMPTAAAPKPAAVQPRRTQVPVRQVAKREGTPPVPANRTTVARSQPTIPAHERPPISRKAPTRAPAHTGGTVKSRDSQRDLPNCEFCGRHFAEDRIIKHQEICRKSSRTKRKPFDSVKQRIKGTEAEQFLKGGRARAQPQKQIAQPQRDWRKTHEDFINSIRAAREYQVSTNQSRKASNMRPSTGSRY